MGLSKTVTLETAVWSALTKLKIDRGDGTLSDTVAWLLELPRYAVGLDVGTQPAVTAEVTPAVGNGTVHRAGPRVVADPEHDQTRPELTTAPQTGPAAPSLPPAAEDVGNDASGRRPGVSKQTSLARAIAAVTPGLKTGRQLADEQKGDI